MEKVDNILIVESECKIIKPIFIKNKCNKEFSLESKKINYEQDKENIPVFEILNILNTPINSNYKKRNIPNNYINSNLFNNELENNLKLFEDVNINDEKELNDNISKSLMRIENII